MMQSTLTIKVNLAGLIPHNPQARVAWLEKFGPAQDEYRKVDLVAAPALWAEAGFALRTDGRIYTDSGNSSSGIADYPRKAVSAEALSAMLWEHASKDGELKDSYDVTGWLEGLITEIKAKEAADAKAEAEAQAKRDAEIKAKAEAKAEAEAWIKAHGSERLRRCQEEGIACGGLYRDERLAAERPGWRWYPNCSHVDSVVNPPLEAFALLDEARKTAPDGVLVLLRKDRKYDEEGDVIAESSAAFGVEAAFLGYTIYFDKVLERADD